VVIACDVSGKLKIVQAGLKLFELRKGVSKRPDFDSDQCEYRICQEACSIVGQYIGEKRRINLNIDDFLSLTIGGIVPVSSLSSEIAETIGSKPNGALFISYNHKYIAPGATSESGCATHTFYIVCWKNNPNCINIMVNKTELGEILFTLKSIGIEVPEITTPATKDAIEDSKEEEEEEDA